MIEAVVEFGKVSFQLADKQGDGQPLRAHLEVLRKQGVEHESISMLDATCPRGTEHVMAWFSDLCGTRQSGFAANPLSFSEIQAYCLLNGIRMARWELRAITALDRALMEHQAERSKRESNNGRAN